MKQFLVLTSVLALTACSSYHTGRGDLNINQSVNISPNIEVGPKVNGLAECNEYLFVFKSSPEKQAYIPSMISAAGNQASDECTAGAVYNAISKNNSDLLIEPQYTTVKSGFLCTLFGCFYSKTKVIVSGYSAKIKSIK